MAPSSIRLTYFDRQGWAEVPRWILKLAGVEFEDKRITDEEWASLKLRTPTGELPVLTIDGRDIGQPGAIVHYLAQEFGFNGCSVVEAAEVHMIWDCMKETADSAIDSKREDSQAEKAKKTYMEEDLPNFLDFLDRRLNGGKKWLVGNEISAADVAIACFLHDMKVPDNLMTIIQSKPNVAALVKRVTEEPNIKKWIETRPESPY